MEQEKITRVQNLNELRDFCHNLLNTGYKHFALYGELGAGKTAMVKVIAELLGVEIPVQSPTFTLLQEYALPQGGWLYHFDLYRLSTPEEALDLGFEEYWESDHYVFIEWPEIIEEELPTDYVQVKLEHISENERRISVVD